MASGKWEGWDGDQRAAAAPASAGSGRARRARRRQVAPHGWPPRSRSYLQWMLSSRPCQAVSDPWPRGDEQGIKATRPFWRIRSRNAEAQTAAKLGCSGAACGMPDARCDDASATTWPGVYILWSLKMARRIDLIKRHQILQSLSVFGSLFRGFAGRWSLN